MARCPHGFERSVVACSSCPPLSAPVIEKHRGPVHEGPRHPRLVDLTGKTFGSWLVLGVGPSKNGVTFWQATHACGATQFMPGKELRKNPPKTCKSCRKPARGRVEGRADV